MTYKELKNNEIIGASQDNNREWVLLLAAICVFTSTLSLALIYQGESGNLKNT